MQRSIVAQRQREGWIVVKMGASGMPDLVCFKDGITEFIEVKRPGEVKRPLQQKIALDLETQGFKVLCLTEGSAIVDEKPLEVCQDFGF